MLAALLLQASSSIDLGPLLDAIQAHSWVTVAVLGVSVLVAILAKFGVLAKLTGKAADPAPAPSTADLKVPADATKAADLLDGKK